MCDSRSSKVTICGNVTFWCATAGVHVYMFHCSVLLSCCVLVQVLVMFVVRELRGFPEDAQPFKNKDELQQTVSQRSLGLDDTMCSSCPAMAPSMQLPHIFVHVYAGMEMLLRGQEEWQMCQIVRQFVKENAKEIADDTASYFEGLGENKSASQYVYSLSRNFQTPDALQTYLFACACNAHTRVHFSNFVWSTVDETKSYYVALDIGVIGKNFVPLCSLDQE